MNYNEPKDVTSPRTSVSNLRPILDKREWDHSIGLIDCDGEPAVGIKWNGGTESRHGKSALHPGNPQSRGLPTCFILPDKLVLPVLISALKDGLGGGSIDDKLAEKQVLEEIKRREKGQ